MGKVTDMGLLILLGCLWAAVLELNKNTLWGWLLTAAALVGFYFFRRELLQGRAWYVRFFAWAALIAALAGVLVLTQGPYKARPAVKEQGGVTDVVTVADGQLRGAVTADGAVEVFTGIPYAMPPVGELRWREPQDPDKWEGVLECDRFAPMSMQVRNPEIVNSLVGIIGYHDYTVSLRDSFRDPVSEDSLYLNIWKPAGDVSGLPVMVYVHGGSLMTGQPWYADYSGEGLARKGAVVVNMGYRLGVFGFLADPELAAESPDGTTGNYGLLDQIKALEWVRDNIAAFGGDPGNVTLAGESAGSVCVTALCTSPLARGLFRRVIAESSTATAAEPAHSFRTAEDGYKAAARLKERFGAGSIRELREVSARDLVSAADDNHHITVDGYVLPRSPYESYRLGEHNAEAILHGFNETEGALFIIMDNANMKNYAEKVESYFGDHAARVLALYPAETDAEARARWEEIYSVIFFSYGHHCLTRQGLSNGIPVYEYYFTKHNGRLGANHGGEEVYFYNNIPAGSRHYDESDEALAAVMSGYFMNYLTCGDPNGTGLPLWAPVKEPGELLELGTEIAPRQEKNRELYGILDEMTGWED